MSLLDDERKKVRREDTERNGQTAQTNPEPPQEWPPPLPLDDGAPGPEFPVERLSGWFRAWVEAEAEATQTPPDLSAMLGLSIGGAGTARKFRVQIRRGWSEPTNIYSATSMPTGERKTAVVADSLEPVQQYEREEIERMVPLIADAESERRILEARMKAAEQAAAKTKDANERQSLRREATQLAEELAALTVPESPVMVCDDETPESLGRLLALQGGRVLLASAEGTIFENAKGRYSDAPNFDVFLKAHAGDELRVGRVSRGREHVAFPALGMALAVQPDVIRGLGECATMLLRGLLARFAWSCPRSKVGQRSIAPPPVPATVKQAYHDKMLALWRLEGPAAKGKEYVAHWLHFAPAADEVLRGLERWLEPQLAVGEELYSLAGWGNKLAGLVARLAGILHMMETLGAATTWNTPILPETVENAVIIGRDYLLPHAKAAFGIMGADARVSKAAHVWASIVRRSESSESSESAPPSVSRREIHQSNRRAFPAVEDLDPILSLLADYGYLRFQVGSGSPGRNNKSPVYWVNPEALSAAHEKAATRTHWTHWTHSEETKPGEMEDEPMVEGADIVIPFDDIPPL